MLFYLFILYSYNYFLKQLKSTKTYSLKIFYFSKIKNLFYTFFYQTCFLKKKKTGLKSYCQKDFYETKNTYTMITTQKVLFYTFNALCFKHFCVVVLHL